MVVDVQADQAATDQRATAQIEGRVRFHGRVVLDQCGRIDAIVCCDAFEGKADGGRRDALYRCSAIETDGCA